MAERRLPKPNVASSKLAVRSIPKLFIRSALEWVLDRWVRGSNRRTVNPEPARRRWFESSSIHHVSLSVSSSGPGHHPFTVNTGVRIPLPTPVFCGCSSMAERKLSTLTTRVRFPSPAPFLADPGFIAGIVQLVEHNLAKVEVASSRLAARSNFLRCLSWHLICIDSPR